MLKYIYHTPSANILRLSGSYVYIYIHMHRYSYDSNIFVYIYPFIYLFTYIHTYIDTYIHTYINTYIHTYSTYIQYIQIYRYTCNYTSTNMGAIVKRLPALKAGRRGRRVLTFGSRLNPQLEWHSGSILSQRGVSAAMGMRWSNVH